MSPKLGTFEGLELLREKIIALGFTALQGPIMAHLDIVSELPVYTGALVGAVELEQGLHNSRVQITATALEEAQRMHGISSGRAMWNLHGAGPEGPYALRIEVLGRPEDPQGPRIPGGMFTLGGGGGDGMMAWFDAREMVKQLIKELGEQW